MNARVPIAMSFSEFMGNQVLGSESVTLSADEIHETVVLAVPFGVGHYVGDYCLRQAHRAGLDATRMLQEEKYGKTLIVATLDDVKVGATDTHMQWVHPDHRGLGLAPQMSVEYILAQGAVDWDREQWRAYNSRDSRYTHAGWKTRRRAFDLLIEMGLLEKV